MENLPAARMLSAPNSFSPSHVLPVFQSSLGRYGASEQAEVISKCVLATVVWASVVPTWLWYLVPQEKKLEAILLGAAEDLCFFGGVWWVWRETKRTETGPFCFSPEF